ncbi:DEAD/DEAH box helicase [Piscinibacter sakaiensis]|uniref:DEAD/DEAH box helicase n=1 Tax=Piscinibacter sakaiensis TaxID=1547922 RepID=UPI003AAFC57B
MAGPLQPTAAATAEPAPTNGEVASAFARLDDDQQLVLLAHALGWTPKSRAWIINLLAALGAVDAKGRRFGGEHVQMLVRGLAQAGWLVDAPNRIGGWQLVPQLRSALYLQLIDRHGLPRLRQALAATLRLDDSTPSSWAHFSDTDSAAAMVRLELFGGLPFERVLRLKEYCRFGVVWNDVFAAAVLADLDAALFARLEPLLQTQILERSLQRQLDEWVPASLPAVELAQQLLQQPAAAASGDGLRQLLVIHQLWSADPQRLLALLPPAGGAVVWADAARAALLARQGRWDEAEQAYERLLADARPTGGKRKGLLPELLALPYVLALLAQGSPVHLERALKFCLVESGRRQGSADSGWGLIALAIQIRRGDSRLDLGSFKPLSDRHAVYRLDFWRWLMRAWLKTGSDGTELHPREEDAAIRLREHLLGLGLEGLAGQLDGALAKLRGEPAAAEFFGAANQEAWRLALAELATLGVADAGAEADRTTRLLWVLDVDERGRIVDLLPFEQKRGPRGWGKPRDVPLTRLAKAEGLAPHDAAVAMALRPLPYNQRGFRFDLAAAAAALVDHPALELKEAPGIAVKLIEAQAELDVSQAGASLCLRLLPPLRTDEAESAAPWALSAAELKEQEALRQITVLRDGAHRARLIRLTAAQKRAAQLIGEQLLVPQSALPQLQTVLQRLGSHFAVHADVEQAEEKVRDVAADSRLRAELSPRGEALHLRLVVAPLGAAGPRLAPGHGRNRLLAKVGDETLGAQRDLALERQHLETVLDACTMLTPPADGRAEWQLDSADDALALLEQLPTLDALAGIDWPQGKPVRVETAAIGQLRVRLRSGRDWLALQGGVALDETEVIGLDALLDWSRSGGSRFVPLGDGRYLALTRELRSRLDELAAVAEPIAARQRRDSAETLQVPTLASGWLDATLAGSRFEPDTTFVSRIERLLETQALQPALPGALQAELRPYQREGYEWAMRLAAAGFGAILADDMGLGKTLQALALLLARASGGAALVVAPTSLGGNWLAEGRRFAPGLQLSVFGDGDRRALIDGATAGDVIVVSYQLLQQHAEDFGRRSWHTLVVDEAQAIKNAGAKRSQAAFELQADFRIALSGTPIENRLAELWSIMKLCNPGLLGSAKQFNDRFAVPIERDGNRIAQRNLRRLIAPFVLRRTKAEVLDDLPPRTETTLAVDAGPAERAFYEILRQQALAAAEASAASDKPGQAQFNILAQLTRLRRAACDPRLVNPAFGAPGAKVAAFAELATELRANGHKALVFSQFVDFLALLREPLDAAGINYQYLDGSTPAAERTRRVAAFQSGEGDLFLISLKAGGFGLNLTVADYVIIADPWWNPAAEDQASGRAHRIGQQRPVTVYRLVNQGTLENRIVALHQHKRELADSVLEQGEAGGTLKTDELLALMRGDSGGEP